MTASMHASLDDLIAEVKDHLASATPATHGAFYERLSITNEVRLRFLTECISRFEDGERRSAQPGIPPVVHRLWLTNPDKPVLPKPYYVDRLSRRQEALGSSFEHVFWHNSSLVADALADPLPRSSFRHIDEHIRDTDVLRKIHEAVRAQKFVMGGDICKFTIVAENGGVYGDLGIDFDRRLLEKLETTGIALFLDSNAFFQPAFMAATANCQIFKVWTWFLAHPEILGSVALDPESLSAGHEIWLHGGVGFTAALILLYDGADLILPVPPNRGLLHHESEGSWYRPGNSFGNATVDAVRVTHLDKEAFLAVAAKREGLRSKLDRSSLEATRLLIADEISARCWLKP